MIPFANRFHGHSSLTYVYKNGGVVRSRLMSVRYVANNHRNKSRIAVVISKKTLKSSVGRNRIRRRVYEYVHKLLPELNGTYDIVFIITSRELGIVPHAELAREIDQALAKAKVR
jgi:ribonuclease P protein component